MANVTVNTTYVGQLASPFVAPAILSADSIANGYISVLENVRHEAVLKKFSGGTIGSRSCEFQTPTTGMVLEDVTLTTTQLQVNEQICNRDLAQDWAAAQMRGADASAPNAYAGFISQYVARIVSQDVERCMWKGNYNHSDGSTSSTYDSFNGIMNLYVAGAGTNENTAAGAWTADDNATTGVLTKLDWITDNAPDTIMGDPDTKILMSRKSAQLYYGALAATYQLPFLNDGLVAKFKGYDIITPAGFPDDTAICTKLDNIYFGTNVLTDMIEARLLDLTAVTGDAVTRVAMLFDAGCQIVDEASMSCARRSS